MEKRHTKNVPGITGFAVLTTCDGDWLNFAIVQYYQI
jgi:hypothetical protein